MLKLYVPGSELFDSNTMEFIQVKPQELTLEHSLVSISKWEAKWKKPFLSRDEKTNAQIIDYVRCMTLTQNVNPLVYSLITKDDISKIFDYINDPMTATWFSDKDKKISRDIITSELIYYWMTAFNIPSEYQKWHLNRLLTLIRVCSNKSQPPKKMTAAQTMSRNKALNAARRKRLHSSG